MSQTPLTLPNLLKKAGIGSLGEWAQRAGISWPLLRGIRTGARRLTPETAAALGDVLGVPVGAIALVVVLPVNRGRPRGRARGSS